MAPDCGNLLRSSKKYNSHSGLTIGAHGNHGPGGTSSAKEDIKKGFGL